MARLFDLVCAQPSVAVERLLEDAGGDIGARRLSVTGAALSKVQLTCLVSLARCSSSSFVVLCLRALRPACTLQPTILNHDGVHATLNTPSRQVRALSGDGYFSEVDLEDVQLDGKAFLSHHCRPPTLSPLVPAPSLSPSPSPSFSPSFSLSLSASRGMLLREVALAANVYDRPEVYGCSTDRSRFYCILVPACVCCRRRASEQTMA